MSSTQVTANALERTRELFRSLEDHPGFREAVAALENGERATFGGAWGSSRALLAAALQDRAPGALAIVCPRGNDIDELCDDLAIFSAAEPLKYAAWETSPDERIIHDEVYGERLRTLKWLLRQESAPPAPGAGSAVVVTGIQALLQPTPSRDVIERSSRWLRVGDRVDVDDLLRWFVEQRFHHASAVELPGEFSARGGILDVFAPDWQQPVRIELFDDDVESIRRFDVMTQRSLQTLEEIEVTILEPTFTARGHLSEYLPDDSWVLLLEPEQLVEEGKHYLSLLEKPDDLHSVSAVLSELDRFSVGTAAGLSRGELGAVCRLQIESVERFSGEVGRVRAELERAGQEQEVFVVSSTEAEVERLSELLKDTHLATTNQLHFAIGHLREGFRLVRERTILISANELFQRGEVRRIPRRRLGKAIDSWLDLRSGDLVVHLSHGIGRYRGVELLDKQGHVEEHLKIEFHGRSKLYVPASKIDLVQKYVGGTKRTPSLAKLGGTSWARQKQAAESAVQDMAAEMLDLQAQRVSRVGIPFAPDGEWQNEFDASFPYTETADQVSAIRSIKADMEQRRPMDRLLCGDVGFGKTEIAMRAAFKAVDSGYQVAVLVPTTILAEQHYHTFVERMAEFPFDIARLSRFCSTKEEREIIEGLKKGRIDIVVGTHRLASRDVQFYNLGLVTIDEEQRFGVEVKERLKTFRSTVDVLTMTATPIPRTLHMSLVGVRDISNLETPPEDRLNVETRVTRFDRELIRHAILRELNRGGQIFFVHNRVNDIEVLATKLRQFVPEARIRIGHGQMREDQLEEVMVGFIAHRFDLLLATTIVENGLDIPNANTIFIDEADRYGLSDLHQLRGRVGRYKHRAYCYLLVDPHKHITPNAARRLRAIEEYSEIGAGFAISMRDLEIRGAGNLLGMQQSGHIATVGYELYCHLLKTAVRHLKQLPSRPSVDVDIDLPGAAFLPDEYVSDIRLKIDLYRRLRRAVGYEDLKELRVELRDRFGVPPAPTERLLDLAELRLDAAIWQVSAIYVEREDLVFKYTNRQRIEQLARRHRRLRVVDDQSCYLRFSQGVGDATAVLNMAKSVLRPD
ncbi:MAG: transcription-repair coupling factor [Pirellulaceae bacterium]